jgi:integrase
MQPIGLAKSVPGSLAAAIAAYYTHNAFLYGFSPATQKMRRAILERFRAEHGDKRLALLRREHTAALLGSKTPYAARNWLKTIRGLMQFCIEIIREDPTGIKPAKTGTSSGFHSWTEAEIAQYEARHAIGTRARLAMALLLYTAQRRSGVVPLEPQHVRGGTIAVRAQKTSRTTAKILEIPVHPALAEVLSATPAHISPFW